MKPKNKDMEITADGTVYVRARTFAEVDPLRVPASKYKAKSPRNKDDSSHTLGRFGDTTASLNDDRNEVHTTSKIEPEKIYTVKGEEENCKKVAAPDSDGISSHISEDPKNVINHVPK